MPTRSKSEQCCNIKCIHSDKLYILTCNILKKEEWNVSLTAKLNEMSSLLNKKNISKNMFPEISSNHLEVYIVYPLSLQLWLVYEGTEIFIQNIDLYLN